MPDVERAFICSLQVFSIPRVGKSVDMDTREEDVEYSFASPDNNDNIDNDNRVNDDGVRTINQQRRNVFSNVLEH